MARQKSDSTEIGVTGLRMSAGRVEEEFLPELRWPNNLRVYKEMMDNDPTVGAMLFAIEMLIRNVTWSVEPFSDSAKHKAEAEFLEECMHDMEKPWSETINDFLTFIGYGFSVHEMVFKLRRGPEESNLKFRSKYSDGKYGFRKFPARSQNSIWEWETDEAGVLTGLVQKDPNTFKSYSIPESKFMLFRVNSKLDNPEGKSVLRNAYRPWYFKKKIEEIEGIGIARDLTGMPIFYVPPEVLDNKASADVKSLRADLENTLSSIHRNEQEGLLLPAMFDENGKRMFEFSLVTSGGNRQFNINGIVDRYSSQIAQVVLADFILLGQQGSGSFALSSNKTKIFSVAIGAWLKSICDVVNQKAVSRLGKLNGWNQSELPRIVHGDLEEDMDLNTVAKYFSNLSKAGLIPAGSELSEYLTNLGTDGNLKSSGGEIASEATDLGMPTGDARLS